MKIRMILFACLTVVLLSACSGNGAEKEAENLSKEDIKDLVHGYTVDELEAQNASITSTELIVTDDNEEETVYDLPEDEFFVSIAPFVNETHPCEIHSLTGCQGELVDQDFDIQIKDSEGNMVLDDSKQTEANGFIDLWLPRDDTYNVSITQDGKTAESEISTFEGDDTCITTLQLS